MSDNQDPDLGVIRSNLIVIGGGELSRVVIEAARSSGDWNVVGFVDPVEQPETASRTGVPYLGGDSVLSDFQNAKVVLGVGCVGVGPERAFIVRSLKISPSRWASIIHPNACVSPSAHIGHGAIVLAGAVIGSGASIGEHSLINIGAMIDHDVRVGGFVHVCPSVAIGGGVTIGDGAFLGMGAIVRDHVTVGETTMVAMGAVVTKNWHGGSTLVGIPASPVREKIVNSVS